jgi:hypothetical protein
LRERLVLNMLKRIFLVFIQFGLVLCASAFANVTPPIIYIALQKQVLNLNPKEFYIAAFEDQRKDVTRIGSLQPLTNLPGKAAEVYLIDLKGGSNAIKTFITSILPVNKSERPIMIKLRALNVNEAPVSGGTVKGSIKLLVSFYLQTANDPVHLADYDTNTSYQRRPGPAQQIEPLIRSALSNCVVYLNNWMNAQAGSNIKLAKAVKISFTDYNEPAQEDTIYYSVNRPLKWTDFHGRKQTGSRNVAEVFAGLGYDERVKVENSIVHVTLAIKVYVPKSACWVSTNDLTDYALNHEQRHFDIAKLVGERFKKVIKGEKLPPDNFDGTINMDYLDALREMTKLQKQYDSETAHSNNSAQQQAWNDRIDKELVELGVKKSSY